MTRKKILSEQVRELIEEAEESRYRIAVDTGIDHAVMSRFMSGQGGLSIEKLDALATYFNWEIVVDKPTRRKKRTI